MKYIITKSQYDLLMEEEQEVLYIPSIKLFGDWNTLQEFLKNRGNPPYSVGGDLNLYGSEIISLGNLISVGGYLNLKDSQIKTLGNLTSVGGYLNLRGTKIISLGNLTSVVGWLDLRGSDIRSLGNLTSVGGFLDSKGVEISSLGNLTSVGGDLRLIDTPISKKMTEKEIEAQVEIGKKLFL